MRLDVDEARRDGKARHVDHASGSARHLADGGDAAVRNGDVAGFARTAAAVEQRAAFQQQVISQ
jgi:hypothetical protein